MVKNFKTLQPNLGALCLNHDGPKRFHGAAKFIMLAVLLAFESVAQTAAMAATPSIPAPASIENQLRTLRDYDLLLGSLALRLTVANAALCEQLMPATGAVLHARNQYPASLEQPVRELFGFPSPLAVAGIVAESPAARTGLAANDGVLAVGTLVPAAPDSDGKPDPLVRDGFENQLVELAPSGLQVWRVRRGAAEQTFTLVPQPACRARFEIVAGPSLTARNDGLLIQLSARYFERYASDELAVVVAHELAHTVLAHRRRLVAAGVSKGLLAEFGRNGRLHRQIEREADRLSVHLLRNAGYDPAVAPRFWDLHGKELGGGLFRSRTHDSPKDRARLLRAEIAAIPADAPLPYLPPLLALRDRPLK
jgi:hypothetical protein